MKKKKKVNVTKSLLGQKETRLALNTSTPQHSVGVLLQQEVSFTQVLLKAEVVSIARRG